MRDFLYRLIFTRDDDLDLLQLVFLGWVLFVGVAVVRVGTGHWRLPTAAWSVIASVFATLAITGTPRWIASLLAQSRGPADVAGAVASVGPEPDLYKDDERGELG